MIVKRISAAAAGIVILASTSALAGLTAEYRSYFGSQRYTFTITEEKQARCPKWDPEKDPNPPVSASKALAAATNFIAKIQMQEGQTWAFKDLSLVNVYGWAWRVQWHYLYHGTYQGPPLEMQCWILMDGSVVEPKVIPYQGPYPHPNAVLLPK